MQFVRPFAFSVIELLLQAMENGFVGHLGLAVGMRVSDSGEPSLAAQVVEIVSESIGVELAAVVEDDGAGNAHTSDDVPPNEPSGLYGGYTGYGLSLFPLCEIVNHHKEVLTLPRILGERAEDIHSPSGEW